jgi:hypothetical protein
MLPAFINALLGTGYIIGSPAIGFKLFATDSGRTAPVAVNGGQPRTATFFSEITDSFPQLCKTSECTASLLFRSEYV